MSLRSKLILFAVVMLLLFSGLFVGAFLSLTAAAREAEEARDELAKVSLLESLAECCAGLGVEVDPLACVRAKRDLAVLAAKPWPAEDRRLLDRLLDLTSGIESGLSPDRVAAARAATRDLESAVLARAGQGLRSGGRPTRRRAMRLLAACMLIVLGGSGTFAWLYARLVRERRHLTESLRRSQKLAALGTLAAGISHELNTPLAALTLSAEALEERLPSGGDEAGYTQAILEEAERCRVIVGGLSDLARGSALDREPVDPAELLVEAAAVVALRLGPPEPQIRTAFPADLPLISADRGRLLQVLVNLLRNAVEAAGADQEVELTARRRDHRLEIAVKDHGPGIPTHLLERVFEPFYTEKGGGLGLGLTLCHRIAELHGGEIQAESPGPGQGATFTLTLPLEAADAR